MINVKLSPRLEAVSSYVKDDSKKIVYEIIWDSRKYESVNKLDGDKTLSEDSDF